MRIFNEVGRWYSIACKILTQMIYVKKKNLNPLKRIRVIIRTPTHGRTDGRTDRQTDGRTGWIQYTPLNFVSGGITNNISYFDSTITELVALDTCDYHDYIQNVHCMTRQTHCNLPNNPKWRHMATKILVSNGWGNDFCLTAPSHYLNQWWLETIGINPNEFSQKKRKICWKNWNVRDFRVLARGQ